MSDSDKKRTPEALEADKIVKKQLVIASVLRHCSLDSEFDVFRNIHLAVQERDVLVATVIAGGYTNYSYKVCLRNTPETAVFVKITFPFALFNPDPNSTFAHERTDNEFAIMQQFASLYEQNAPVASPYYLDQVDGMKVLITEFASTTDDHLWKQYVRGNVDLRVIENMAKGFAKLHSMPVTDPDFNDVIRSGFDSNYSVIDSFLVKAYSAPNPNRLEALVQSYGEDFCEKLKVAITENYFARHVHVHGDGHPFNVLVEKADEDGSFGPHGSLTFCDWEISVVGPVGLDIGFPMSFPIACILWHAMLGRPDAATHILDALDAFWDNYVAAGSAVSKTDERYLRDAYLNGLGWCGISMLFSFYILVTFVDHLTYPEGRLGEVQRAKVMESIGIVGLHLIHLGFMEETNQTTQEHLRDRVRSLISVEMFAQSDGLHSNETNNRRCSLETIGLSIERRASIIES